MPLWKNEPIGWCLNELSHAPDIEAASLLVVAALKEFY